MKPAVHAEWTKLRTVPGTGWLLLAIVVSTVAVSALAAAVVTCSSDGCSQDLTKISLTGIQLGQALVAVLAVAVVGGEYGTGMIHSTLVAMPRRWTVLAAKAIVVGGVVLVAGAFGVLGSVWMGRIILPGKGFTADHGFSPLSLADPSTLRAAAGSVVYLALIAVFSLGIATAVRDSAAAIGVILGLLLLFPVVIQMVSDPDWQRHLRQIAPMSSGLAVQTTVDVGSLPLSPWAGIGVLGAWSAGALLVGGVLLYRRDG